MNATTAFHGNVVSDIAIAKAAGFDGVELQTPKLTRYLDAGFTRSALITELDGFAVSGVGAVLNIERQADGRSAFLQEVRRLAQTAAAIGAPSVQLCTGPVDWNVVTDYRAGQLLSDDKRYRGTIGMGDEDALNVLVPNVRDAAEIASEHGVGVFLEPLAWSNINRHKHSMRIIDAVGRDNVGLAVDTWHYWTTGDTPEDVARTPKELIHAVHISDGLAIDRVHNVPQQDIYRDVVIGGGSIPLQEWVDAAKSTGYDGWYATEMFSTKAAEHDMLIVASTMRNLLAILVS